MTDGQGETGVGEEPRVRCQSCGFANRSGARWCSNCAQPLAGAEESAAATEAPVMPPPAQRPVSSDNRPAPVSPPAAPSAPASAVAQPPTPPPPVAPATQRPAEREPAAPSRSSFPLLAVTAVLLIATVLLGLAAFAPSIAPIKVGSAARGDDDDIRDVASRFTQAVLTYNHATVQQDIDRALQHATGDFREQPQPALGGNIDSYRNTITSGRGTSVARVMGVALASRKGNTATVLVVSVRRFGSEQQKQPARILSVFELTVVKTGDGWKVSKVAHPSLEVP